MTHPLRGRVAIVGAADTDVGVIPDRTATRLCVDALVGAVADAGLRLHDVDALVTFNALSEPYTYHAEAIAEYVGLRPRHCISVGTGGGTTFTAIHQAAAMLAAGACDVVAVAMADRMRSGLSREKALLLQSSTGHPEFEAPFGAPVTAYYALIARAHMHEYGTTLEQLAAVSVATRAHAVRNPAAQMRTPLTIDDVMRSKPIADPLRMLDCSLISDGGAAIVMTRAERATDLRRRPVYLLGAGEGHRHEHISQAPSLTTSGAVDSGRAAYAMAGLGPKDVDFAEIYDCFTPVVLVQLEDLGFCAKGEGGAFVAAGHTAPGGSLPVNTHGGLLSHCHSGHPASLFALTEAVTQLRGTAGERQLAKAEVALVHAQGGILSSHCTLILSTERRA